MNWNTVKLADVCKSISDGDHQAPPKSETGIPFVTISNITSTNKFDFRNTMHVPQDYYERLDGKRRPQVGDVLYSVVGSFGIPVLMTEEQKFVFQRHIAILRPDGVKVVPAFLYYTMLNRDFYMKADAVALGAAQRTVSLTALREMEIQLPDYDTQKKVVNVLRPYDELIENNQKQIKLLEEAAQRLYKEWFVDLRFPGYEGTEIIDGIPNGWTETTIDSFIELQSGYAFKSSSFDEAGNYKIVTIKNVQDGVFDGDNVNKIVDVPDKMPSHCKLQEGDSLLSLTGNVGRVCTVVGDNYLLNQRVAKIASDYPYFSYCLFRSEKMFHDMNNLANGAAQQNLSPIRTGKMKVIKPDNKVLLKFEHIVKSIFDKKIVLNRDILVATQARDRLLPKLMNGEIEVTNYK